MLNEKNTLIICIDIQEKLVNMLGEKKDKIKQNAIKLMNCASILNIDTIITEQYPKGLGETIEEIKNIKNFTTLEKTTFSAFQTDEIKEKIKESKKENIVIFGIESHICVYQTILDLLNEGYNVYFAHDCSSSRSEENHRTALELTKQFGAKITSLEIILFEFLKSSRHPNFKEIQALIK